MWLGTFLPQIYKLVVNALTVLAVLKELSFSPLDTTYRCKNTKYAKFYFSGFECILKIH